MFSDYLAFAKANPRALLFGAALMALSSPGQTFFVALSGEAMRAAFDASDGALGGAYAAATLAAGVSLGWVGRWVDVVPLRRYALFTILGLAVGCTLVALAPGLAMMAVAFYVLRLTGQGLLVHIAMTATARRFARDQGKALGLISLGGASGEALLPPLAVALLGVVGWRGLWWIAALVVLVGGLAVLRLLPRRSLPEPQSGGQAASARASGRPDPGRVILWRDRRFLLAMPAMMAPSFVTTGFFFHQTRLAADLGWGLQLFAAAFLGFAVMRAVSLLSVGPVLDRLGAARLLPVYLLPLCAGMVAIIVGHGHPTAAVAYLLATGLTSGVSSTLSTALWTEFYGVARLGAVRSTVAACSVISSALAPAVMGAAYDAGVGLRTQAALCLAYLLVASLITTRVGRGEA